MIHSMKNGKFKNIFIKNKLKKRMFIKIFVKKEIKLKNI